MAQLNAEIWTLNDLIDNHSENYNYIKHKFASHFSTTIRGWTEERDTKIAQLTSMGLSYEAVEEQCHESSSDEVRECVLEQAREDGGDALVEHARVRMDAQEYEALAFPVGFRPRAIKYRGNEAYQRVRSRASAAQSAIDAAASPRWLSSAVRTCEERALSDIRGQMDRIQHELLEPAEASGPDGPDGPVCRERADSFCPEDTAPATKRSIDVASGSAAAGTAYFASSAVFGVVGALLGGFSAATGGLGAIVAGVTAGWVLGLAAPGNSVIAAATFFWFSVGPEQCACFPRDCGYDEDIGGCAISDGFSGSPGAVGNNPFATALPYMGFKCEAHHKNHQLCELKMCVAEDFSPPLQQAPDGGLFGRMGRDDGNVFNCLSKTGSPTHALAIEATLPGGTNNTALARNALFSSLGLA